jgi:HAMP domain-containing protein
VEILRDVVSRCDAAGLPVLAVKGVVTARLLYADVADRPIADVDIRIRRRDFWHWHEIATRAGWRCWNSVWTYRTRSYTFSPLALDVETHVGPPGMCALTVDEMLARSTECELGSELRVRIPETHDHAVLLVVNAYKDWLVLGNPASRTDLDRIARSAGFEWEVFVDRALRSRIGTITWLVATWLEESYGNEVWGAVRAELEARAPIDRFSARLYRRVAASSLIRSVPAPLFRALAVDGRIRRLGALTTTFGWLAERWVRGHSRARGLG